MHARGASQDVYDGQWKNGLYNGTGRYSSTAGGDEYEGQWKDDVADGLGKYRYAATGDVYEGGFQAGLRSGHGKYRFANGVLEDRLIQTIEATAPRPGHPEPSH